MYRHIKNSGADSRENKVSGMSRAYAILFGEGTGLDEWETAESQLDKAMRSVMLQYIAERADRLKDSTEWTRKELELTKEEMAQKSAERDRARQRERVLRLLLLECRASKTGIVSSLDVAKEIGASYRTQHKWRQEGLPFIRKGKYIKYDVAELREWLMARRTARRAEPESREKEGAYGE